jgi:hypothetical protein
MLKMIIMEDLKLRLKMGEEGSTEKTMIKNR